MRFSLLSTLVVALATDSVVASTWFSKAVYNKWHETELERWLSDHNIPYPTPADRKDLENLVKDNWQKNVISPYQSWDTQQLLNYLHARGLDVKKGTEKNTQALVGQVQASWHETEDQANEAYGNVKDWIFDTWSDSQLKAFLDKYNIPNPQPKNRDTLIAAARANYQAAATKAGETAAYPGDWLYATWSDSELKAWLDERGYPVPQPSNRDKVIASIRRYSHLAAQSLRQAQQSASASAESTKETLADAVLNSWSDSQVKEWLDKNGIPVPQGSKRNELLALARKHRAKLTGDNVSASAASAFGAATSSAGNEYAQASNAFNDAVDWIKEKIGIVGDSASASASSVSNEASKSASSASKEATKSASKAKQEL